MNNIFCRSAHNSITIDPMGNLMLCCWGDNFILGNLHIESIDSIKNKKIYKDIIQNLNNKNFHSYCNSCKLKESINTRSKRTLTNSRLDPFIKNDLDIICLDISFSNLCNMNCNMCNSTYSSRFENQISKSNLDIIKNLPIDWNKIIFVDIKGGEPFIQNDFVYFLNFLIEKNLNKNISLRIFTNGTASKRLNLYIDKLLMFKKTELFLSLDGNFHINSKIRNTINDYETKFLEFCEEINKYSFFKKIICFTVQRDNINYLLDFLNFKYNNQYIKNYYVDFNILVKPTELYFKNNSVVDYEYLKKTINALSRYYELWVE